MRLIVLGKNRDDKGTQLEKLTCAILSHQGFKDLSCNVQVSGASEIDVVGVRTEECGTAIINTPVICECKAHESPITMTDWLKFVGKIFIERKKNHRAIGIMLALSGANGAVRGSLDTDFGNDPDIQLIANDGLMQLLSVIYDIVDETQVRESLSVFPISVIQELALIYYDGRLYWHVMFADNRFTICDMHVRPLAGKHIMNLLSMIPQYTRYQESDFVDIPNTVEMKMMLQQIEVASIAFIATKGPADITTIIDNIVSVDNQKFDKVFVEQALFDSLFLAKDNNVWFIDEDKLCYPDLYKYILSTGGTPIDFFASDFYQNHIDNLLLDEIQKIQNGLDLTDVSDKVLAILRVSPRALLYSLTTDPILKGSAITWVDDGMRELSRSHFIDMVGKNMLNDYRSQLLSRLYPDKFRVKRVIEQKQIIVEYQDMSRICLDTKLNYVCAKIDGEDNCAVMIVRDNLFPN